MPARVIGADTGDLNPRIGFTPEVLLDAIIQIFTSVDPDRLQPTPGGFCRRFVVSQETIASMLV